MPMFLSPSAAPIAAELCTSARLIWPLVSACRVGPLVGWMTRPFALSLVKYVSPALTPPREFMMPAMNGKVGPDWDGSFMPTCPFHCELSSCCQVVGGLFTLSLLYATAATRVM